jgi:hypothetical protein
MIYVPRYYEMKHYPGKSAYAPSKLISGSVSQTPKQVSAQDLIEEARKAREGNGG